jgi:hypothetical protein
MSGMTLAMAACLAGQRDWRRITLGQDPGPNRVGFSIGVPYGSMPAVSRAFRGATIAVLDTNLNSVNGRLTLSFQNGFLSTTFVNSVEIALANGQSAIFSINDPTVIYNTSSSFTSWNWDSTPLLWVAADTGKTLSFALS